MNEQACDPDRLSSFLRGELGSQAERELTAHLDSCESCGKALEDEVADASVWQAASEFLDGEDGIETDIDSSIGRAPDTQVWHVLSQLLPTDDPESLGRIGGHEVTGVIGSGGMSVVLKARDRSLDRVVAVKVMAPHLAASGSARQRFAREAKATAAVLHPNVIAIHGVSIERPLPYLVMPYVRGESLQERLDTQGPLPLVEILRIGSQVASGLAAAHEQGLVHRDIKPGNILMEQAVERVTVTDFGLARMADDASLTRSGGIAGTPQYMSPEQARGESVDQTSDLFSLGSVLYALATGRPPFRAESSFGVMRKITDELPRPIRELNPEIPEWFCAIIGRLMAKNRDARFKSAMEVHNLLEACLGHAQQPTVTRLPEIPGESRKNRVFSFRHLLTGVAAMFLIATFLFFVPGFPLTVQPAGNIGQDNEPQPYRKKFVVAFSNPDETGTLNVDIKRGSIHVIGHDGDEVIVELSVPDYAVPSDRPTSELRELRPNALDFEIENSGGQIKVDGNSRKYILDLQIKVPRKTNLILDSYRDGKILVRQVEGAFDLRSQNNDIGLEQVSGSARLWSYNGNLTASFETVTENRPLYFESYNGSIDLTLPETTKANVRYRSGSGKVSTDFDIALSEDSVRKVDDSKIGFEEFVQGTLNGGGPVLTLETEKGDIRLKRITNGLAR